MKKGLLALLLLLGTFTFAAERVFFEDHDLGIALEVPKGLEKNWEVVHCPSGAQFSVYQTNQDQEAFYTVVFGKLDEGQENNATILAQIQAAFKGQELLDDDEFAIDISFPKFDIDIDLTYTNFRLKMTLIDEEEEMSIFTDVVQIFGSDGRSIVMCTACSPGWMKKSSQGTQKPCLRQLD
jgi:hypothetical protein